MNPFDNGPLGGMIANMQQKAKAMQEESARAQFTGNASDLVKVTLTGDYQVVSVELDEKTLTDKEMLEDLLRAAIGDALGQVKGNLAANVRNLTGGLPIPPGLIPGL